MAKVYPSKIDAVNGTRLLDDGTFVLELRIKNGNAVRLSMDVRLANEVIECLAALKDEAVARAAPQVWGTKAAAYRRCKTVIAKLDVEKTVLLIDFDEHEPHRVGVAIPLEHSPAMLTLLQAKIDEANNGSTTRP